MVQPKKRQWQFSLLYLIALLLVFYVIQTRLSAPQSKTVSYSEFVSEVKAGHLAEVSISSDTLTGKLKDDAAKAEGAKVLTAARLPGIADAELLKDLESQNVKITGQMDT
ncbi:MAG: ATP-dependent metallopeptidase FtsH/Yme1/Tma family protein, partial [Blastocatellia bacterium]